MDIFTHSISWYLIKKLFYNLNSKKVLIMFIISALFPDIDIIWSYNNHNLHRVITHSLILIPFTTEILTIFFYYVFKKEFKLYIIYIICFSWIIMHIILDSILIWWIPLFWPFSNTYYSFNLYTVVIEPLFFPIYLYFIFYYWKVINKISLKMIKIISFFMITIFLLKFWLLTYSKNISNIKNNTTVWIINSMSSLSIQRYYNSIWISNNIINWEIIDIFKWEIIEKYEKTIYIDKNNICSNLHKWFLYIENWIVSDIRYTLKPTDTGSCFTWKKI